MPEIATGAGTLQPYGRINVFHASGGADVAQFLSLGGSTAIRSETGSTSTEVAGGATLTLAAPPQRIVTLLPSLTESVCELDQCHRLVGVDRYSNWPESVKAVPRVGGGLDPNIESIVALKPDLVLAAGSTRGADRLQALGLNVLRLEPRNHADALRVWRTVAQAVKNTLETACREGDPNALVPELIALLAKR